MGERAFKKLTQARIAGVLQLLEHTLARESKPLELPDSYCFLEGKFLAGRLSLESGIGLLFFYRLTFPATCHI